MNEYEPLDIHGESDGTVRPVKVEVLMRPDDLVEAIANRVVYEMRGELIDSVKGQVHDLIADTVDKEITSAAREKVQPIIDDIVENGWQRTNQYGEPTGSRIGIAERVSDLLFPKGRGYGRSWVDERFAEVMHKKVNAELAKHADKIKAAMDKDIATQLREAMLAGLARRG